MLPVLFSAVVVLFMFGCDYVFDGNKVFHVKPVSHKACQVRPFTTVQQLVLSK
jgi:hypothetical protein